MSLFKKSKKETICTNTQSLFHKTQCTHLCKHYGHCTPPTQQEQTDITTLQPTYRSPETHGYIY